jgi:hypothetical protein
MAGASRNLAVAIFLSLTLSFNSAQGGGGGGGAGRAGSAGAVGRAGGMAGGAMGVSGAVGAGAPGIAAGGARGSAAISLGVGGVGAGVVVGAPSGVAPTPSGPLTTVGVSAGRTVIVNPSQVTPSVLDKAVRQTAPNLNAMVPAVSVSSPTLTPSVGNQVGSTMLSAPSVANPSQTTPNANAVVPIVSPPTLSLSVGNQVGSTVLGAASVANSVARGVDLNAAVGQTAPTVNAVVPIVSSPTLSLTVGNQVGSAVLAAALLTNSAVRGFDLNAEVQTAASWSVGSGGNMGLGNASGITGLNNASGISALSAVGGSAAPNLNAGMPSGAPPSAGIADDSTGQGNVYGVIPAARGPAAGGAAPNGKTESGDTTAAIGNSPSPTAIGQSTPVAPVAVQGIAENQTFSRSGRSTVADDGVSTKIVQAKPCTSAARETDGTTSCVGIPSRRR